MKIQFKRIVFMGSCMMCFSGVGFAETRYVTDVLKLPLRTGPSTEYKILALVESGQQLEVVEPGDKLVPGETCQWKRGLCFEQVSGRPTDQRRSIGTIAKQIYGPKTAGDRLD